MANIIRITIGGNIAQLEATDGTFTLGVRNTNDVYHVMDMKSSKKEMKEFVEEFIEDLNDIRWELSNDFGALKGIKDAEPAEEAEEAAEEGASE